MTPARDSNRLAANSDRTSLPNIRQPNLKDRVYELLLNMIIDGKYRDNDMLPPERVLGDELGVSRTVIREAIKSLETRGLLQVIHGKGIKVAPAAASDISDAFMLCLRRQRREVSPRDLMEMRLSIETEIAACAARRAEEADLRELESLLIPLRRSFEEVVVFPDQELSVEEHQRILECIGARHEAGARGHMVRHLEHTRSRLDGSGRL